MNDQFFREVVEVFNDVHVVSRQYRKLIKEYAPRTHDWPAHEVIDLGLRLWETGKWNLRWVGSDFIAKHPTAHNTLKWKDLKKFGEMMDHWGTVDIFNSLAGPAWRRGQISDEQVLA
ncbi:DNA alkylation repair protein [candidate division WOR-3 bacterium]|nr:DNA alkylation repair protein [candidate division WOR-3 bacterium]